MLKRLKMAWRGCLLPEFGKAKALALLFEIIRDEEADQNASYWVRNMVENDQWVKGWRDQYCPLLEKALSHETRFEQTMGMRALAMELIEYAFVNIFSLYETDDPLKEWSENDRALIVEWITSDWGGNWTVQKFFESQLAAYVVTEPSKLITLVLAERYLGDKTDNYARAYEFVVKRYAQIKYEKIVCEARGATFQKEAGLTWYEWCVPTLRDQIIEGRNVPLDDELRILCAKSENSWRFDGHR